MATDACFEWAFEFMSHELEECRELNLSGYIEVWVRLIHARSDPDFCKALGTIHSSLENSHQRQRILLCLADTVFAWAPDKLREQRDAMNRVRELNIEISKMAALLARKLEIRSSLVNTHSVGDATGMTLFDCAERFSILNRWGKYKRWQHSDPELFSSYILPKLDYLRCEYDLKYWPDMHGLLTSLSMLAKEAANGPGYFYDEVSLAAMNSRKSSSRDFVRAFIQRAKNDTEESPGLGTQLGDPGMLPYGFTLGHTTIASLVNAAMCLYGDEAITPDNVRHI